MCERMGPMGLGDGSSPVGSRGKTSVGGLGDFVPQKLTLLVNECLNFDVLGEKIVIREKYHHKKLESAEATDNLLLPPPPNTPLNVVLSENYSRR